MKPFVDMPVWSNGEHVVRLIRVGRRRWRAVIFEGGRAVGPLICGTTVLGVYANRDDARRAAWYVLELRGVPRVCTWRDVVEARKTVRRKAKDQ